MPNDTPTPDPAEVEAARYTDFIAAFGALARELPQLTDKLPEPSWARIAELTDAAESALMEAEHEPFLDTTKED